MKEGPILFSAPMVHAIRDGRKTQTRRIIKPQPSLEFAPIVGPYHRTLVDKRDGEQYPSPQIYWGAADEREDYPCPYGQPGDRLWVRETWNYEWAGRAEVNRVRYFAGGYNEDVPQNYPYPRAREGKWRPSIHMPRWASRITLEITAVRVERLQDISETDAATEGCALARWYQPCGLPESAQQNLGATGQVWNETWDAGCYRNGFATLWERINGRGSWAANPWVWVVEFRRIQL